MTRNRVALIRTLSHLLAYSLPRIPLRDVIADDDLCDALGINRYCICDGLAEPDDTVDLSGRITEILTELLEAD